MNSFQYLSSNRLPKMLRKVSGIGLSRYAYVYNLNVRHRFRCIGTKVSDVPLQIPLAPSMEPFRSEGFVWTSRFGTIPSQELTVDQRVWKNVDKWYNKIAIVCGITGRQYTYGQLREHSAALAYRLCNNLKLQSGDTVAISMPNVPEFAIVALGALEAGLTITTINPAYTPGEQAMQLAMTDAKLVFCISNDADTVLKACARNNSRCPVVAVKVNARESTPKGVIDLLDLINPSGVDYSKIQSRSRSPRDICLIPFSSGTTGLPKGVMLTHHQLTSNMEMTDCPSLTWTTTIENQDVIQAVLPYFHIYGFVYLLMSKLSLGCKLVTLQKFDPISYISTIAEYKATMLPLVPPILLSLTNDDRCTPQNLSSVRTITSGAAPSGSELIERFHSKKGQHIQFFNVYGMTELSSLALQNHGLYKNYASIGWPAASTEVKIVSMDDPLERGLDINACGEFMIRSPSVMLGYLNNPLETAKVKTEDGWLHTGDIGFYDHNGDFYITDRAKDMIKVQAFQVAPAELEDILLTHPNLLDAAVIGIKHDKFGEVPKAFVVAQKDVNIKSTDIQEFIAQRCARFKWLIGGVQFIDEVPKSKTGKILRNELRKLN